eukprot:TRINITY_DN73_c0_g1_i1.p1 TRINITY_DN73_c0_g1~~TRINITY_DN73_c0_g1_i1.p1  ORF type:complete len:220 (-),score=43.20 TRINITY_DN73_c0_g1_i1:290-883(-)
MKFALSVLVVFALACICQAYDRKAAVDYAAQWYSNCNHDCSSDYDDCTPYQYWDDEECGYESQGGDCADFVSQCLVESGHPFLAGSDSCRGFCGKVEVGAKRLGDCLGDFGWHRQCGYMMPPPSDVEIGDVLIMHSSSCDSYDAHATIVTTADDNVLIACHSPESYDIPYDSFPSKPYFEWITGGPKYTKPLNKQQQ